MKFKEIFKMFKKLFIKKAKIKYSDFYKVERERQRVLDAFVDHSLISALKSTDNGFLDVLTFSKELPFQDIKYIYDRTVRLLDIMKQKVDVTNT